jgi:deazaflavin-dependent oxidoreductase (nitroreductase family)
MTIPAVSPGRSVAHQIVARVALTSLGLRLIRDVGDRIDPALLRLTRGRVSTVWPFPAVLVTHEGAKSGKIRTSAVVYFTDGGRVILIATNFGNARNPSWYYNVKANPVVELYGRGISGQFKAEEVHDDERDRLFQRAKDAPGPYGKYEEVAGTKCRRVPVIAFAPLARQHRLDDRGDGSPWVV